MSEKLFFLFQNEVFNDSDCLIGATFQDCGYNPVLSALVVAQSISSFILFYFFAKFAHNFFSNPTNANRKMASLVLPGIFYSTVNIFFCYYPNYADSMRSLYMLATSLRCFTYIVAANQVIFLIRVISPNFGLVLYFILILIGITNALYAILTFLEAISVILFDFSGYTTLLVIENLSILLYTFVCVYIFVFSKDVEWIVSPGYCKKMKILIFVNSLFSFFNIVFRNIFHSGDYIIFPYIILVLNGWSVETRRTFIFLFFFLQKFVFGSLPILLVVIAMIYMKPNDNIVNGDSKTDSSSENTSKVIIYDNLIQ